MRLQQPLRDDPQFVYGVLTGNTEMNFIFDIGRCLYSCDAHP